MDRRQTVVQRAREFFGERLDDVLQMVRQDRQDMRGWQEPAHVRAVLRRVREEGGTSFITGEQSATALRERPSLETDFGRARVERSELTLDDRSPLVEPERAQQRETTGLLLEAGAAGIQKATRGQGNELTPEEILGLECVLILYGRPAVLVNNGVLGSAPPLWNLLEDQREEIETVQRGVGRIELFGHPEYDWAGTGFLVSDNVLMTTRRTAELFVERQGNNWQFRPGITTWMNYRSTYQDMASANYRVRSVLGVHDRYDLALLEVERPQINGTAPISLSLAGQGPERRDGRPIYLVGYPVRDARRNEPEAVARIFRDVYNVKRVQPGLLRGEMTFHEVTFLRHDAAPLGQNGGSPILDLETHQVLGLQTTGRYLETSTAVPLYLLRDDPLLRQAGLTFTETTTTRDRQTTTEQLERLARSRYWNETRAMIGELYRRAFGERTGGR
jgi:hypothetical protein